MNPVLEFSWILKDDPVLKEIDVELEFKIELSADEEISSVTAIVPPIPGCIEQ